MMEDIDRWSIYKHGNPFGITKECEVLHYCYRQLLNIQPYHNREDVWKRLEVPELCYYYLHPKFLC